MVKKNILFVLFATFSVLFAACTFRDYNNALLEEHYQPPVIGLNTPVFTNTDGPYTLSFSVRDISGLTWVTVSNENSIYKKEYSGETTSDVFTTNFYYSTIGRRIITIRSSDSIDKISALSVIVDVKINPPTLNILQPSGNPLDTNTSYILSGTVWDVSNHSIISLQLFTNQSPVTLTLSNSNWSYVWNNLSEGSNTFYIRAFSDSLNTNTSEIHTIIVDTHGPILSFLNVSNNMEIPPSSEIIISNNDTYAGVAFVDLFTNGVYYKRRYTPTTTESFYLSSLPFGTNTLQLSAEDNLHQKSSNKVISVIVVAYPNIWQDCFSTNRSSFNLSGNASIDLPFKITGVFVSTDNGSFVEASFTTNSYTLWDTPLSGLTEGSHTITLKATADNGKTIQTTNFLSIDLSAPMVSVNTPSNQEKISGNTYTLSGTADDNISGVEVIYYSTNGNIYDTTYLSDTNWSVTLSNIAYGFTTNFVFAKDWAGNASTTNIVVVFRPAAPYLSNLSPVNNILTNQSSLSYTWTAGIAGNFSITNGTVSTNGSAPTVIAPIDSYSATYPEGTNVTVITLYADSGLSSAYCFTNYIDSHPPVLAITNPTNYQIVDSDYNFSGTVSDQLSGTKQVWISIHGNSFSNINPVGNAWSYTVNLTSYGVYTNKVYAIDNAGNTSLTQTLFTERKAAPVLTIDNPTGITNTAVSNFDLTYSFSIQGPYFVTNFTITRATTTLITQSFSQKTGNSVSSGNFYLTPGTNILVSTLLADSGLSDTKTNTVIYAPNDPTITITSPASNSTVTNLFTFSGNISNISAITRISIYTNSGEWQILSNTNSWNLTPILIGTNHFEIIVEDAAGHICTNTLSNINVIDIPKDAIHVASWGQTNWSGSIYFPLNSISAGVTKANSLNLTNVYMEGVTATPGHGLDNPNALNLFSGLLITNNNISLIGGWDSNFTTNDGVTVFDGETGVEHVVVIKNASHIALDRIVIRNGYANSIMVLNPRGSGLLLNNVSSVTLKNIIISNNSIASNGTGAGLSILDSDHIFITNALIFSNAAPQGGVGGGISISGCDSFAFTYTRIEQNFADEYGGGIFIKLSTNANLKFMLTNNNTAKYGGGLAMISNTNIVAKLTVVSNIASLSGGGIYALDNNQAIFRSSFLYFNEATSNEGGAIKIEKGGVSIISNCVFGRNNAGSGGSDIALFNTGLSTIVDSIMTNSISNSSVFLHRNSTMTVIITNNKIGMNGDSSTYGIYEDDQNGGQNIFNSIFADNVFYTNTLEFLMYDANQGDISDITVVNNKTSLQCSDSHGNTEDFQ